MIMKRAIPVALTFFCLYTVALYADYHEEGKKFYMRKQYNRAREMFLKSVQGSGNGDSYYFLGEIEKNTGNYEAAEKYFRSALLTKTSEKYRKNAFWNIIILTQQRGDYEEMARICLELWRKTGDTGAKEKVESLINRFLWSDNKEAVELYNQGLARKKNDKTDEAANLYRQATSADSNFLAPRFELAMMAYHRGDYNTAAENLRPVVQAIPFYGEASLVMGDIEFNRRYFDRAAEYFTKSLEFGFNNRESEFIIYFKRGNCYYQMDDLDKAKSDLSRASDLDKKSVKPLLLLSAIQIRQKNYDEALSTLTRADKIDRDNPMILFQIGSIYYKKNDGQFLQYFDRLFDLVREKTSDDAASYRKAFTILLQEHYRKGNYARALAIIEALPDRDKNFDIQLIRARSMFHTGKYQEAADIFERLSLNDEDKFLQCRSLAATGRKDKARVILEKLIAKGPYRQEARRDEGLSPVLKEIEDAEKRRIEEEKLKREEERRREEEKRRLENERRIEAERKAREEQKRKMEEEKRREAERMAGEEKARLEKAGPAAPSLEPVPPAAVDGDGK